MADLHECSNCGEMIHTRRGMHCYAESGLSHVVLQEVEIADCAKCGNSDLVLRRPARIHEAIASALANSPGRLSGEQLRFLRKHLGLSGDELGEYLHTDKTKISKWERGEDRIGPSNDRLIRLLAAALDKEMRPRVSAIAEHLPQISDDQSKAWELHVDVATLTTTFIAVPRAA